MGISRDLTAGVSYGCGRRFEAQGSLVDADRPDLSQFRWKTRDMGERERNNSAVRGCFFPKPELVPLEGFNFLTTVSKLEGEMDMIIMFIF